MKFAVKRSFCLSPSGWRTLHHSLLGNSRPPTTELVRTVRVEIKKKKRRLGQRGVGGLAGNESGRKTLRHFGCGSKSSVSLEGRGGVTVVISCYRLRILIVCVSPATGIQLSVGSSNSSVKCKMTFLL